MIGLVAAMILGGLGGAPAQAQTIPSSADEIAGLMSEIRGWRQIADHGWSKSYFGAREPAAGPNPHFLTSDLHNELQGDMMDPTAASVWGFVFEREYDCAAQRTRIVRTLTLRVDSLDLDERDLDWTPRGEIVSDDGQAAFAIACG